MVQSQKNKYLKKKRVESETEKSGNGFILKTIALPLFVAIISQVHVFPLLPQQWENMNLRFKTRLVHAP